MPRPPVVIATNLMILMKMVKQINRKEKEMGRVRIHKTLRVIMELSGFPALIRLYKILVSLAITSSSAEK